MLHCVETCLRNDDCGDVKCCTFGYCSYSENLCKGLKQDFDYCDVNDECMNKICENNRCMSEVKPVRTDLSLIGCIAISAALFIITIGCCCVIKRRR